MTNATLIKYAELVKTMKELEAKQDELKAKIIEDLEKNDMEKIVCDFGTFTVTSRPSYEYSKKVKKLESDLKIMKVTEVESGVAKKTDGKKFIVFTTPKEK